MADPARRAKLVRGGAGLRPGLRRPEHALEHIAFRVGRIEQSLARIAAAIESVLSKG